MEFLPSQRSTPSAQAASPKEQATRPLRLSASPRSAKRWTFVRRECIEAGQWDQLQPHVTNLIRYQTKLNVLNYFKNIFSKNGFDNDITESYILTENIRKYVLQRSIVQLYISHLHIGKHEETVKAEKRKIESVTKRR